MASNFRLSHTQNTQGKGHTIIVVMESKAFQENNRRSAGYLPTVWDPQFIKSITTPYTYDNHGKRLEELQLRVKELLGSTKDLHGKLSLIDKVQRLGVGCYFEIEIKEALQLAHQHTFSDLHTAALQFRLLRANCFSVSSDVFDKFTDEDGKFPNNLKEDVAALLSLYEASYLGTEEEAVLKEAKYFSTRSLRSLLENCESKLLSKQIKESLEVPLHWRLPWTEARDFIVIYQGDDTKSEALLELAKLHYNLVQSVYLTELKELAVWWEELNFKEKMNFSRDRLLESYFCAMGCIPEPKFSEFRKSLAKSTCAATILDDIYDVYGSVGELQELTETINRWDIKAPEELPECMKLCYSLIYDVVQKLSEYASKDLGIDILPYMKKQWFYYARAYLVEAEWLERGYLPTFEEYVENGWKSIGVSVAMLYAYFGALDKQKVIKYLPLIDCWPDSEFFYWTSLIARLNDDLKSKTEMERGDAMNAINCYMVQEGVSEEEARDHVRALVSLAWTKINKLIADNSLPPRLIGIALDNARCFQRMYQHDDWFTDQSKAIKECVVSSFFKPIPLDK